MGFNDEDKKVLLAPLRLSLRDKITFDGRSDTTLQVHWQDVTKRLCEASVTFFIRKLASHCVLSVTCFGSQKCPFMLRVTER